LIQDRPPRFESLTGAGNSYVGEAGFAKVDGRHPAVLGGVLSAAGLGLEVCGDLHGGPFAAFGPVAGGDDDVCFLFGMQVAYGGEDEFRPVLVDDVDKRQQVAAGEVRGGVLVQFVPRGEQAQLGVTCAASGLELTGGHGKFLQGLSAAGHRDALGSLQHAEHFANGAGVGPAQHCIGVVDRADTGVEGRRAREPQGGFNDG
jgi:hypothetical protein